MISQRVKGTLSAGRYFLFSLYVRSLTSTGAFTGTKRTTVSTTDDTPTRENHRIVTYYPVKAKSVWSKGREDQVPVKGQNSHDWLGSSQAPPSAQFLIPSSFPFANYVSKCFINRLRFPLEQCVWFCSAATGCSPRLKSISPSPHNCSSELKTFFEK